MGRLKLLAGGLRNWVISMGDCTMDFEESIRVSLILASGNVLSVSKEEPDDGGLDLELPLLVSDPEDSVE